MRYTCGLLVVLLAAIAVGVLGETGPWQPLASGIHVGYLQLDPLDGVPFGECVEGQLVYSRPDGLCVCVVLEGSRKQLQWVRAGWWPDHVRSCRLEGRPVPR